MDVPRTAGRIGTRESRRMVARRIVTAISRFVSLTWSEKTGIAVLAEGSLSGGTYSDEAKPGSSGSILPLCYVGRSGAEHACSNRCRFTVWLRFTFLSLYISRLLSLLADVASRMVHARSPCVLLEHPH